MTTMEQHIWNVIRFIASGLYTAIRLLMVVVGFVLLLLVGMLMGLWTLLAFTLS